MCSDDELDWWFGQFEVWVRLPVSDVSHCVTDWRYLTHRCITLLRHVTEHSSPWLYFTVHLFSLSPSSSFSPLSTSFVLSLLFPDIPPSSHPIQSFSVIGLPFFPSFPKLQMRLNISCVTRVLSNSLRVSVCVTWNIWRVCVPCPERPRSGDVRRRRDYFSYFLENDWPIILPGGEGVYKKAKIPTLRNISVLQSVHTPPWLLSFL